MSYAPKPCPICGHESKELTFYECEAGHTWWQPHEGPQTDFVASDVHEILYGGSAGGGKSAALVMIPIYWIDNPHFRGIVFRREAPQLVDLIALARRFYPIADPGVLIPNDGKGAIARFPSGATVRFTSCKDEADAFNYGGQEFQFIAFDELTHFSWNQYSEIKSRCRSSHKGLPRYLRATSNPGGQGHDWVFKRWGAWLDPEFEAEGLARREGLAPLEPSEVARIVMRGDDEVYVPKGYVAQGSEQILTRTFIPAKLADNPALALNDPSYARNLLDLDPLRREQLAGGNWLARPAKGLFFKRAWFEIVDAVPASAKFTVRYWDRAATVADENNDPDYTVGLLACAIDELLYVLDVVRFRGSPGEVQATIRQTAEIDGQKVAQVLELDPGQAGLVEMSIYAKILRGFSVTPYKPTGDKQTRARPVSAQAYVRNVRLVRGLWNKAFLEELEAFPEGTHDDQVDAFSGAHSILASMGAFRSSKGAAPRPPMSSSRFDDTPIG